ncbi:hypothetical protein ABEY41_25870 [Peribacillus butanolivorans]
MFTHRVSLRKPLIVLLKEIFVVDGGGEDRRHRSSYGTNLPR